MDFTYSLSLKALVATDGTHAVTLLSPIWLASLDHSESHRDNVERNIFRGS